MTTSRFGLLPGKGAESESGFEMSPTPSMTGNRFACELTFLRRLQMENAGIELLSYEYDLER